MNKNRIQGKRARSVVGNVALMLFCLAYLSPIYIIFVNSFKSRAEMYENVLALPKTLTWEYYAGAVQRMDFINVFKNSLIVTLCSVAVIAVLCSMTAWMLVRTHTKLSRFLYSFLIVTMLIPFQTVMMPLMQEMNTFTKALGIPMKNSLGGLVFMYAGFGAGMGVFLFHGFIKSSVPVSLEEAAIIDGCNVWQVFWRIVFPILKPTTVTVIILDVIWIWNDYLLPSLTLTSNKIKTIPVMTSLFFGTYTIEWNMAMAALTLTILPVILFYFCAQKHIIKGVMAGAVKG
ncbi:MAG: carbohydrate ABC transporter permease [Clostridiales bacterium]|nr:carbohydrate ABC transporter permease [Clostridiales bacterium]